MPQLKCQKCKKPFKNKRNLERHANVSCKYSSKNDEEIRCELCDKTFSRKDALIRHLKACAEHDEQPNDIQIVSFGKDGIESISDDDFEEILNNVSGVIPGLIINVNFNALKPQHHNIHFPDKKSSSGETYEEGSWSVREINEMVDTLIDAKINDLKEIKETFAQKMNKKIIAKIDESIECADYMTRNSRKKLRKFIKIMIYKHREVVAETRKIMEEKVRRTKDEQLRRLKIKCERLEKEKAILGKKVDRLEKENVCLKKKLSKATIE